MKSKKNKKLVHLKEIEKINLNDFSKIKISRLKLIASIIISGLVLSLLYHYFLVTHLGKNYYPFNTFLFIPADRFHDYSNIYHASTELDPYTSPVSVYFPFTFIVMYLFTLFPIKLSFVIFLSSFIVFFLAYLYKNIPIKNENKSLKILYIFIFSFMTYPFLFVVDRGNLEVWLFMSLVMFIYYYLKGKDNLSIIFLSIAIAFKVYPAVLALLFVVDRKYFKVIYTGLLAFIISVISAGILKGGVVSSVKGLMACLSGFNKGYMMGGSGGLQHNSSLFVPLKLMYYNMLTKLETIPTGYENLFNKYYFIFALIIFSTVAVCILTFKFSFWKKVTLMIITFMLLPQISYDYKLINVFIPLILFINAEENSKYNTAYSIMFGLLLIPKDYLYIVKDLSISSIINPLLMLAIIILIITETVQQLPKKQAIVSGKPSNS